MNFMFEWQEQYLMSEILFLPWEHKIHIFELMCNVLFITQTYWWPHLLWFSEDFRRFSKTCWKVTRMLLNIFRKFPMITEDRWRLILSKHFEEDPKMFWSYTNEFRYNWRGKLDISEIIDIFTGEGIENMLPESQMWFCMNFNLGVVYFPVKHSCLYNKKLFWRPNLRRFFYCLFYFFLPFMGWTYMDIQCTSKKSCYIYLPFIYLFTYWWYM